MSINKVILIGNVGKDPDVRYLDNNVRVANFSMATTEKGYTMSNGTQVPDKTEWHNIVLWRGLAEIAEKYVRKGSQIYIEGKIKSRVYEDKTGVKRYITEIYGDNLQLLGKRESAGTDSGSLASPSAIHAEPLSSVDQEPFSDDDPTSDLPF
ncbi:MAG: single-stranded DNA-binding protein [Prevotellaceae bacterium]|jgi:single-strand DNA-binding protein|nr:single-stranded DNA-binding protein [Prevotellaceae bacterium]